MEYMIFIAIVAVFLAVVFTEGVIRNKNEKQRYRKYLEDSYGKASDISLSADEIERIGRYDRSIADGTGFHIDDITWNDLSMDDIFTAMDTCSCMLGEEQLYHRLHTPVIKEEDEDYTHFSELREYFEDNDDERITMQEILHGIGINRKTSITTVFDHVNSLEGESNIAHYAIDIMMVSAIAMLFLLPGIGVIMLIAAMVVSIGSYLKMKRTLEPVTVTFNYTAKMLRAADEVMKRPGEVLENDKKKLEASRSALKDIEKKSIWITSGAVSMDNPAMLILEYLKMFFHIDLIAVNKMVGLFKEKKDDVEVLRRTLGDIDASIAAGSYRFSLSKSCDPRFLKDDERHLEIGECIHPLIKDAVYNSIDTKGPVLLTGSNASGKSTFLKTVAICALMGQTLGYVPAEKYTAPRFEIYTSMALSDNILNGESYFVVEIKSLKRILDAEKDSHPILCCIDEVLRGTNTVERVCASTKILKSLDKKLYIPFAATHDIELTQLLKKEYTNYHFDEEVTDNDVNFNYKLKEGAASSRNAIKLLKIMGYDEDIIKEADKMVEKFMSSGRYE
ncbi:MAG: hypothetical protein K6F34_08305 [Lachnospiraceae bacterium]|nr:hypothetical protein [Lachnospiraceae bacterium]